MGNVAVRVEGLGKQYRIGQRQAAYRTLRETITDVVKSPFRRAGQLLRGQAYGAAGLQETIWALRDISFTVEHGEAIGIIGRNGAGKSTLLKILSRITEPTEGEVRLRGRVGALLEVGTGFHPELTGRENIYLNGAILGMRRQEIDRKFDEIVDFSGIEKFIDTPVKHFSSGMGLRLGFAVAAHLEPEILVVDEVLAVGDAEFQKKCMGKMSEVAHGGRTVLFVSHNMAAVQRLCSRTILLDDGRIERMGDTDEVVSSYLSGAALIASAVVELSPAAPGAPASAKRLRFFTEDGRPQSTFRIGEKWHILLEFEVYHPVSQLMPAVGLVSNGIPIISLYAIPQDMKPGCYKTLFVVDLPLTRCTLRFAAGLTTHNHALHYVDDIGSVTISEIFADEQVPSSGLFYSRRRPRIEGAEESDGGIVGDCD